MKINKTLEMYMPPCPICGSLEFKKLAANDRYGMRLNTVGCHRCGLCQTWPRPTPREMARFYRQDYRNYYQATTEPDSAYIDRYSKAERLAYTARLIVNTALLTSGMRVLDVGCAEGTLFVNLLKECAGLDLTGVEPSEDFAAYARKMAGCRTYPDLESLRTSGEAGYDVIVVNHVLEHVDDPTLFLVNIRGLLASNGRAYLDVPDVDGYGGPQDIHIAHLFHFSRRTLSAALNAAALKVEIVKSHSPPHHPPSIYAVARKTDDVAPIPCRWDSGSEKSSWDRITRIGANIPIYLIKLRIARIRWVVRLWRRIKMGKA